MHWSSKQRLLIIGCATLLVVVLASGIWLLQAAHRPLIPKNIQNQLTSVILVPQQNTASIQRSTIKYDKTNGSLSYVARYDGHNVIVSEQAAPDVFSDVPDYYSKWLSSFGEYTSFNSTAGTVYLAKSSKLGSYPVAVMSTSGTLLFARPNASLSENDWHRFFLGFSAAAK